MMKMHKKTEQRIEALEQLLERCEVAVCGIDGGGLDDLVGLAAYVNTLIERQLVKMKLSATGRSVASTFSSSTARPA